MGSLRWGFVDGEVRLVVDGDSSLHLQHQGKEQDVRHKEIDERWPTDGAHQRMGRRRHLIEFWQGAVGSCTKRWTNDNDGVRGRECRASGWSDCAKRRRQRGSCLGGSLS
jgi:hypothetical protein